MSDLAAVINRLGTTRRGAAEQRTCATCGRQAGAFELALCPTHGSYCVGQCAADHARTHGSRHVFTLTEAATQARCSCCNTMTEWRCIWCGLPRCWECATRLARHCANCASAELF